MAKFKIAVSFVDHNFEEIIEIEARSLKEASEKCEKIKKDNEEMIKHLESKNIYTTRVIEDCKIQKLDWRDDVSRCVSFLEKKEE